MQNEECTRLSTLFVILKLTILKEKEFSLSAYKVKVKLKINSGPLHLFSAGAILFYVHRVDEILQYIYPWAFYNN